jgi:hypothetical protein
MAKPFDPKAKAKRQKIILAVLGVVFLAVMAYQLPTVLSALRGPSTEATTTTPPPTPVAVAPGTPAGTPAPTGAAPAAAAGTSALIDSDPPVEPAVGQLVSFDRFESKDPFAQQLGGGGGGTSQSTAPVSANPGGKAEDPEGFTPPAATPPTPAPAPAATARTATISVNGASQEVAAGGTFPSGDPIFKLVSLTRSSAKIGIVGGGYSNGSATVTLRKGGKAVTLMNTADGTTYVLRLVGVG